MIAAVLSGFLLALFLVFGGGKLRGNLSLLPGFLPLTLYVYFFSLLPQVGGEGLCLSYSWVPSIGVDHTFRLDGLSMLFALMITGIGALVFFYTSSYMRNH